MASSSLPSPPAEDINPPKLTSRKNSAITKSTKSTTHKIPKRLSTQAASSSMSSASLSPSSASPKSASFHSHSHDGASSSDGRHKRVWKACERCRMKKTKCDGEFPCKRCKDDGLICTAGVRKKTEYKQLPKGYAEVLEHTQFALVATVHKLYAMVRNQQTWDLGEPELNDRGMPIVHNIASKLNCVRPNSEVDLPDTVFPEDDAGMKELARQLGDQQQEQQQQQTQEKRASSESSDSEAPIKFNTTATVSQQRQQQQQQQQQQQLPSPAQDFARSPSLSSHFEEHSDYEFEYPQMAPSLISSTSTFSCSDSNVLTMSPAQSLIAPGKTDFNLSSSMSPTGLAGFDPFSAANIADPTLMSLRQAPQTQQAVFDTQELARYLSQNSQSMAASMDLLNQGVLESEFGKLKPHVSSNPDVMMGMGDPMIWAGLDEVDARFRLF